MDQMDCFIPTISPFALIKRGHYLKGHWEISSLSHTYDSPLSITISSKNDSIYSAGYTSST